MIGVIAQGGFFGGGSERGRKGGMDGDVREVEEKEMECGMKGGMDLQGIDMERICLERNVLFFGYY